MMFVPSEGGLPSGMGGARRGAAARPSGPPSKFDYIKTFYTDPFKWSLVKSFAFFGVSIYLIRDLASNDLLPMD